MNDNWLKKAIDEGMCDYNKAHEEEADQERRIPELQYLVTKHSGMAGKINRFLKPLWWKLGIHITREKFIPGLPVKHYSMKYGKKIPGGAYNHVHDSLRSTSSTPQLEYTPSVSEYYAFGYCWTLATPGHSPNAAVLLTSDTNGDAAVIFFDESDSSLFVCRNVEELEEPLSKYVKEYVAKTG